MFRYAKILRNDTANGEGVGVAFFHQGCPHHCKGCFNEETWDFNGGQIFTDDTLIEIVDALSANGVKRHLSILGGEPLCDSNIPLTRKIVQSVREKYPDTTIYLWTGYIYEDLLVKEDPDLKYIFNNINTLIDGPFIEGKKDLTLKLRGSSNQRIINLKKN